jgi:hypothetical protein
MGDDGAHRGAIVMVRTRNLALVAVAALALAACNDSGKSAAPPTTSVVAAAPDPVATGATKSYDVLPCFYQVVPGTAGLTVSNLVIPDVVTLDFSKPSTFPNGRQLFDPVIDITFAAIFLDLTKHSPAILAGIPLGPAANEVPFRKEFPYLAVANGTVPVNAGGTDFNFRTDPASAYVQVDRMGMPAVATALIASSSKVAYNDGSPTKDGNGDYVNELVNALTPLTNSLADDFIAMGLTPCAKPR